MPNPSKVDTLPEDDRKWLEHELVQRGFSGYEELSALLEARGIEISKSALGRFGKAFKDRVDSIRRSTLMARALRDEIGDDEGVMNDAVLRMAQHMVFEIMQKIDVASLETPDVPKLMRAIGDLSRATVSQKKYQDEVRARAAEAAEEVEKLSASGGLTAKTVSEIKARILGIAE